MSELKSIAKLRGLPFHGTNGFGTCVTASKETINSIADEIEAEIAERYMELPTNSDDEVMREGDLVTVQSQDRPMTVCAVSKDKVWFKYSEMPVAYDWDSVFNAKHVKTRTLEDVLDDLQVETVQIFGTYATGVIDHEMMRTEYADSIRACAAEIRELMGGDE